MLPRLFYFSGILLFVLTACTPDEKPTAEPLGVEAWLPLELNGVPIEAQIVLTPSEQRKGLMYREELGADRGMLFPYKTQQVMSFWMANTPLPLDIGFFDEKGMLLEIHRMVPYDTTKIRSSSRYAQYALEMNAGWFAKHRLFPGVKLDMDLLAEALRQRGEDPAEFGIRQEKGE